MEDQLPAPFWDSKTILQCKSDVSLPQELYKHLPRDFLELYVDEMVVGRREGGEHHGIMLHCSWIVAEMLLFLGP